MTMVLIVDDNGETRDLYRFYLAFVGMEPQLAVDGIDAVQKARTLKPDVIVMDLHMPRQSGIQAMRALKGDARTKDIPVVALTGDPSLETAARDAYCAAFVTKPCLPERLAAVIVRAMTAEKRSKPSPRPRRPPSPGRARTRKAARPRRSSPGQRPR